MLRPPPSSTERNPEAGFTLIEMLAALALASLIFLSLNLAMTTVQNFVVKSTNSLSSQDAITAATRLFARDAARIIRLRNSVGPDAQGYLFEGSPRQMIYPLLEHEGVSGGGLYLVRLRVAERDGVDQLIRERALLQPGERPGTDVDWGDAVALLEGAFDIVFAYRAQRSGMRDWADGWSAATAMPEQLRLTIKDRATGRLRVPVLVQSILIDAEVECAAESPGCGKPETEGNTP